MAARRIFIDSHNFHSQGARNLARYLNARRIRQEGSRYRPRSTDIVINWGKSTYDDWLSRVNRLNHPALINSRTDVGIASNKLQTFEKFQWWNVGKLDTPEFLSFPEYTDCIAVARGWVTEGSTIVSRSLLRGSEGRGMSVGKEALETIEGVPCKLWVKYKLKSREYRVHVFRGEVIDIQQKKRENGAEANEQIRSHANGWVFAREGILDNPEIPVIKAQALLAVQAIGLDFGAVDIIYSVKKNKCWVLEVNTSPGLEGTTVQSYGDAIRRYINAD